MYELNLKVNQERLKDLQREAENQRRAQESQRQEKNNVLQNAFKRFVASDSQAR